MLYNLKQTFKYLIYLIFILFFLIACFVIYLIWFQPAFNFPKPTGKYNIGTKTYYLVDTNRKETSANDPAHPNRELMVTVWYPAEGKLTEKPTIPYTPYQIAYLKKTNKLAWLLSESRPIYSYAEPEAPISLDLPQYPVIIFSHGLGCSRDKNTANCEELASHGYIVIAASHTYASNLVIFPDGRIVDGIKFRAEQEKDANTKKIIEICNKRIEVWISDIQFLLDQFIKLTNNKESIFYKRVDQKNIGIFGHSFGGGTAVQMCRRDPRIKAGVALDGFINGPDKEKPFHKPFMFMFAENIFNLYEKAWTDNDRKNFGLNIKDEQDFKSPYLSFKEIAKSDNKNVYTFLLKNSDHMIYCDMALLKHATLFSSFIGDLGTGTINGFRATKIINDYLVNFFDKYLKEKPSKLLDGGENKYPEIEKKNW